MSPNYQLDELPVGTFVLKFSSAKEIERLYQLEFGHRAEWITRIICAFVGCYILYVATGLIMFLLWFVVYSAFYALYYSLYKRYMRQETRLSLPILVLLFGFLTGWFVIIPASLIISNDQTLQLAGIGYFAALMIYLSRRNDTYLPVILAQMVMVYAAAIGIVVNVYGEFDSPQEKFAVATGIATFLLYYTHALLSARSQRLRFLAYLNSANEAQKMAAIGQLAGGVAHGINNVLTVISGNLELYDASHPEKERKSLIQEMQRASNHGARTISQLMIFTRQAHKQVKDTNVAALLDQASELILSMLPTGVSLSHKISDTSITIRTDTGQAINTILNLVTNAMDALPNGGRIIISCAGIKTKSPKALIGGQTLYAGSYIALSVEDTGSGIPSDILHQVHEPFFTTKPLGKGTGLGLPAVLGFASEFGHGFEVISSHLGTKVTLYFQDARSQATKTEHLEKQSQRSKHARVRPSGS
jgi:signal transduction histidine kinase